VTELTALLVGVVAALALPAVALGAAAFVTPRRAAYCGVSEGEAPHALICWTPDDGFTVAMGRRGRPTKGYDRQNKRYYEPTGRVLRFGQTWKLAGYWRCTSRRSGLTCTNQAGHGWWLGRFSGYKLF
jgi:hypothetical protein